MLVANYTAQIRTEPRRSLKLTGSLDRNLMIDPKTRKVIVVENPLLSTRVKEMVARVLFDNLQVSRLKTSSCPPY